MRIVSVNAWCGVRHDELIAWLPEVGADVVCLQEVTRTPGHGGWVDFADAERNLATRANLFDDVRRVLPRHQGFFVASDAGPIGLADGSIVRQDFGLAVFVDERHPVIGQASSFVSGSFVDHAEAWALDGRPRIAQGLRLLDRGDGDGGGRAEAAPRTLAITHLHGLRDTTGKHDTPARAEQAERLADLVDGLRQPGDVTIVAGDLNLLPDSATFEVLGRRGLVDLVGTADTRTSLYAKPVRHASYLLVSDPDVVRRFEAPATPEVSDHRALVLDL